jgi:LPLT family lysophospholipid transporter-like MFS transporter
MDLLSSSMLAVMVAQFLSALADNALFIAAIALVKLSSDHGLIPLLQGAFIFSFIVLAPFVGPFADSLSKRSVMFMSNGLKLVGAGLMFSGLNPLLCYGLVGIGAAAYSPAKYGILSQMFHTDKLVKANGMLEGSTIAAILLGVLAGGLLADISLSLTFWTILSCYLLAALINLLIPKLPAEHPLNQLNLRVLIADFTVALKTLFKSQDARFSLLGTSVFWGSGSTLRLMLFAWVPVTLAITTNQMPANLMGVVSIGIVIGAVLAGVLVSLKHVNRAMLGGLLLGPFVMTLAYVNDITTAIILLILIGTSGGFFIVPLNALLQKTGHESVGAGHAVAVQNFSENLAMLAMVGLYALAVRMEAPVTHTVLAFGVLILLAMTSVGWLRGNRVVV